MGQCAEAEGGARQRQLCMQVLGREADIVVVGNGVLDRICAEQLCALGHGSSCEGAIDQL